MKPVIVLSVLFVLLKGANPAPTPASKPVNPKGSSDVVAPKPPLYGPILDDDSDFESGFEDDDDDLLDFTDEDIGNANVSGDDDDDDDDDDDAQIVDDAEGDLESDLEEADEIEDLSELEEDDDDDYPVENENLGPYSIDNEDNALINHDSLELEDDGFDGGLTLSDWSWDSDASDIELSDSDDPDDVIDPENDLGLSDSEEDTHPEANDSSKLEYSDSDDDLEPSDWEDEDDFVPSGLNGVGNGNTNSIGSGNQNTYENLGRGFYEYSDGRRYPFVNMNFCNNISPTFRDGKLYVNGIEIREVSPDDKIEITRNRVSINDEFIRYIPAS